MIFSFILAGVFLFGALLAYDSCCIAARIDRMHEEYWRYKIADQQLKRKRDIKNGEVK